MLQICYRGYNRLNNYLTAFLLDVGNILIDRNINIYVKIRLSESTIFSTKQIHTYVNSQH